MQRKEKMNKSQKGKNKLSEIGNSKSPQPKELRKIALKEFWDLLILNHLASEDIKTELSPAKIEADMYSIIQNQFENIEDIQLALARGLREIVELRASNQLYENFFDSIYEMHKQLEKIEKVTSAGGRKINLEIYEVAFTEFNNFKKIYKRAPTGGELSRLVQPTMEKKKGESRSNGTLYMPARTAKKFINDIKRLPEIESWQELVKTYHHK
jgi:hypothetical protein